MTETAAIRPTGRMFSWCRHAVAVGIDFRRGPGVDIPCGARCAADLLHGQYQVLATSPDGRASARNVFIDSPAG